MSTSWGYYCETDGAESPAYAYSRPEIVLAIYRAWPHIKAMLEIIRDAPGGDVDIKYYGAEMSEEPSIETWLYEHGEHALMLRDEYGGRAPLDSPNPREDARLDSQRQRTLARQGG